MPDVDHGEVALEDLAGKNFATVPEVASILRWDRKTVRRAIILGEIPHVKAGGHYRVPVSWLRIAAGQGATR
jgi:excisionase family DNA binding protein